MQQVESGRESFKNSFNKKELKNFAKFAGCTGNFNGETKENIVKQLFADKKEHVKNFLDNVKKLEGCGKNKVLSEIYKISPDLGNELEGYKSVDKPFIVFKLMERGLDSKIDTIAALTKITRPKYYSPISIVGAIDSNIKNIDEIIKKIEDEIKKYNKANLNKIKLERLIYIESENRVLISYRIEKGKHVIRQFPFRGKEIVTVYPTVLKQLEFDFNKKELLTRLPGDDFLVVTSAKALVASKNPIGGKVRFINPENVDSLKNILKERVEKKKELLNKIATPIAQKELKILDDVRNFKRTKIQLKNISIEGHPTVFLLDATDDVDKALKAMGIDDNKLIKNSEYFEFAITYKGAKINISPTNIRIDRGKSNISDFELGILIDLLVEQYEL